MKMKTIHLVLPAIIIAGTLTLTSFKAEESKINVNPSTTLSASEEWSAVYEYVEQQVITKISKKEAEMNKGKKVKTMMYSRCPSGMEPEFVSDSLKTDRYVYGKVQNWVGCQAIYYCNFKVNVTKHIALVRGRGEKVFIPVKDWLAKKYETKQVQG